MAGRGRDLHQPAAAGAGGCLVHGLCPARLAACASLARRGLRRPVRRRVHQSLHGPGLRHRVRRLYRGLVPGGPWPRVVGGAGAGAHLAEAQHRTPAATGHRPARTGDGTPRDRRLHRRVGGRLRRRHARPREWLDGVAAADPAHVAGRAGPSAGYRRRRELLLSGPSRVAEDGGASADHGGGRRMSMRTWYGVRRLYEPRFRERVLLLLVIIAAAYYAVWSIVQWVGLTPAALRFDFVNYFGGAQAAAHGTDIYADFKRSWGTEAWVTAYIYPPFFAELLAPLTPLGLLTAARIWLLVVHAAFIGSLTLILRLHPELSRAGRRLVLLAAFGFMPVYLNLKFQQVATLWLLLLTASLWAALRRRDHLGGAVIAMAASLKVTPIFLIPPFARLGRLRLAAIASAALLALTVTTMLASPGSWQFFTVVLPRIGLGTANWDNGSIDGLVSRVVQLSPRLLGDMTQTAARVVIVLAALIVIGLTLWRARQAGGDPGWTTRLGVASLISSLLMVSSVTWQHHLVTLLLPMATAIAWITARRPAQRYGRWLLAAYVMCWVDRRAFPPPADQQVHTATQAALVLTGTSIKLIGVIMVWLLLLQMLRREAAGFAVRRQPAWPADAAA